MHFRSFADLARDISHSTHLFPADIDVIAGIPRSGITPACMAALYLNLPLTDVERLQEGRAMTSGSTRSSRGTLKGDIRHALVIDDSVQSGESMAAVRESLSNVPFKVTYCAVYGVPGQDIPAADLILRRVENPRLFEWNMLHHPFLEGACVDIDGVLCLDPTAEENDDGIRYASFLSGARPLHTPTVKVGALVTGRLEKYRAQTEDWLSARGVQYGELVMLDAPTAEARRKKFSIAKHKGEYYRKSPLWFFIESEESQASQISNIAGKPVLCTETGAVALPGPGSAQLRLSQIRDSRVGSGAVSVVRRVLGESGFRHIKRAIGR